MKGVVVENKQNNIGTYDGIIETSNKNKYHFLNNDNNLNIGSHYNFNMATSNIDNNDNKWGCIPTSNGCLAVICES